MLYIIGLGIYEERDMSLKALEALKKCKKIYAEFYTSPIKVDLKELEKLAGKKVEVLERKQVEEESMIIDSAAKQDTAFIAGGMRFLQRRILILPCSAGRKGLW